MDTVVYSVGFRLSLLVSFTGLWKKIVVVAICVGCGHLVGRRVLVLCSFGNHSIGSGHVVGRRFNGRIILIIMLTMHTP
jgi:hypothetical protein